MLMFMKEKRLSNVKNAWDFAYIDNVDICVHDVKMGYKCLFCDKVSNNKRQMKKHCLSANHEGKNMYERSICGKIFDKKRF